MMGKAVLPAETQRIILKFSAPAPLFNREKTFDNKTLRY